MVASGELREIEAEIVREEDGVGAAEEKGSGPVPPTGEEAPEIAERCAYPAIEASLHGHCGGELGGAEGDGDAAEECNEQVVEQGHAGAGAADLLFEDERAAGRGGDRGDYAGAQGAVADCVRAP